MKLAVVHDKDGRILAAAELDGGDLIVRPHPVDPEHAALEVDVPEQHRTGTLYDMCQQLRVDPKRKQLVPRDAK
jgi:hypothetical protein